MSLVVAEIDQRPPGRLYLDHSRRCLGGDALHAQGPLDDKATNERLLFVPPDHIGPNGRCIPGARSRRLFLSTAYSHPPSREPQILSGLATRYRVSPRLPDDRHQPPHARRVRHGDELLPVAARGDEVLVSSETLVTRTPKVCLTQAHQRCVPPAAGAGVRG